MVLTALVMHLMAPHVDSEHWWFELSHAGDIFAMETGKSNTPGWMLLPVGILVHPEPLYLTPFLVGILSDPALG